MNKPAERDEHAISNARGWSQTITLMAQALRAVEFPVTVDGETFENEDDLRERISESPLSVMVRDAWYAPGDTRRHGDPEEFEILLSTGGPALRIRGELDEYCQPSRAWIEYQDWGIPWTEFRGEGAPSDEDLLTFCQCFYFGG